MSSMTKDEINVSLFDEIKRLKVDHEAEIKEHQDTIMTLGIDVAIRDTKIRDLKKKLALAVGIVRDVLDGIKEHDLQAQTGLPEERCKEIFEQAKQIETLAQIRGEERT